MSGNVIWHKTLTQQALQHLEKHELTQYAVRYPIEKRERESAVKEQE